MRFEDDLAGGVVLVRPALQSPDYVAGVSGWAVKIDGSAEFNDIVVRGTLESNNYVPGVSGWHLDQAGSAEFNDITIRGGTSIGGEAFYYSGAPAFGTLIMSIAATAGTDIFGNAYQAGLTTYSSNGSINLFDEDGTWTSSDGSRIQLDVGLGAAQYFTPQTVGATVWDSGKILTTLGASNRGGLNFVSPSTSVNTETAAFTMLGGGPTTNDSAFLFVADRFNFNGNVELPAGRTITDYDGGAFTTYTPVVTNGGTAVFTGATGWYQRIGSMYFVSATATVTTVGSGALNVGMTIPITMEGGAGDQVLVGRFAETRLCYAILFAGADSATFSRFRIQDGGAVNDCRNMIGTDLTVGRTISVQGWVRAA